MQTLKLFPRHHSMEMQLHFTSDDDVFHYRPLPGAILVDDVADQATQTVGDGHAFFDDMVTALGRDFPSHDQIHSDGHTEQTRIVELFR